MRKQVAFESKGFEISEIVESNFNLGADDLIMGKVIGLARTPLMPKVVASNFHQIRIWMNFRQIFVARMRNPGKCHN